MAPPASLHPFAAAAAVVVCGPNHSLSSTLQVRRGRIVSSLLLDAPVKLDEVKCVSLAEDPWSETVTIAALNGCIQGVATAAAASLILPHANAAPARTVSRVGDEDPFAAECVRRTSPCGEEDPFLAISELDDSQELSEDPEENVQGDEGGQSWPHFRFFPRRKVFPREEPWLLESIFLRESHDETPHYHDVSVEIFINSSDCTMQRIAIVENKKLVQLLLEPVNSSFQVGDVYLGVVKRLLPGMNGIFVDIGTSRNALLEVNMRQYPHLFAGGSKDHVDVEDDDGGGTVSKPATLLRRIAAWRKVRKGTMMIVQVKKEALRQKGPQLTANIALAGRFWVLSPGVSSTGVGVSRKIIGLEKSRLKKLATLLQPAGFGLTVRSEAANRSLEELEKDLMRLVESWSNILKRAEVAAAAGKKDPVPVLLQRAMGQTLRTVRDGFNNEVERFVVDSAHTYDEVTGYLQEIAPHLSDRVELYAGKQPIFDAFNLEAEIEKSYSPRVELPNGAYLVLEETEALVSIDVNGGVGMLGNATQREAVLGVNLAAARQIATELRLRDIGGIIVVDFIDMEDPGDERLVFEEMRKAIERDRSKVAISEISEFGLMELTRARDRPSVTSRVTESCSCCGGTGRIESLEMTVSKIERAIKRILAHRRDDARNNTKWPAMELRLDAVTSSYLRSRGGRRVNQLSSALNVLLTLKACFSLVGFFSRERSWFVINKQVASDLPRGQIQISDDNANSNSVAVNAKLLSRKD